LWEAGALFWFVSGGRGREEEKKVYRTRLKRVGMVRE